MLGGDHLPAVFFSNWLLCQPLPAIRSYYSQKHKTIIDLTQMISFLTQDLDPSSFKRKQFMRHHHVAIKEIAKGQQIRDVSASNAMKIFFEYIKNNFFIVVTNTQLVERWVKDSNECTYSGKDEHFASMIAICRSFSVFDYKFEAKEKKREEN